MSEVFQLIEFFPGDCIFEEYALADSAYILKEGRVEISMMRNDEKLVLAELKPVSIFGEMALLSREKRRTATAKALERVKVIKIEKTNFEHQMEQTPSIIAAVLHGVTQRLIDTSSRLHPGYVERREHRAAPPDGVEKRKAADDSAPHAEADQDQEG